MSSNEQLEQPLWELIYELLSPEEEAALLERITSEPELARAYAKVKLQSDLVAAAAKCDDPRGILVPPAEAVDQENAATGGMAAKEPVQLAASRRSRAARAANWLVAAAALGLVVMSALSLSQLRSPAEPALEVARVNGLARSEAVRTTATTPAVWNTETTNFISVRTASMDGLPAATPLELKLYSAEGEVQSREFRTDATGLAEVEVAGALSAQVERLEIAARDNPTRPLSAVPNWVRSGHITHLTTDLPAYQPGDTVSYRSLSLSRFDQRVDGELSVEFDVLDQQGAPLPNANHVVTSERGVGSGAFTIPEDETDDELTILARSPDGAFPEQRRQVRIRKLDVPTWHKALKLARESYEPGDEVKARLSVKSHDGQPAAGKRLSFSAMVDQQPIALDDANATTDREGNYDLLFSLPNSIKRGDAFVTVNVEDDKTREQLAKAIPIHTGRVDVQFFPEGGELAADLSNQVYFEARNLQGQPIHLEGRIVDDAGDDVARAVTIHEGRGRFALTTRADTDYRLIVEKPAGAQQELVLPPVSAAAPVVLHTAGRVLEPLEPVDVTLRMRTADRSLVLAAACRGGLVGLQAVERTDFELASDGTSQCLRQVKLAPSASGVIRVTVYDSGREPLAPIAERLVYRRPAKRIQVQIDPVDASAGGQQLALGLQTTDEFGQPLPASLGVSVVNQALLNVADDQSANLETYVFLTSEIRDASELEDANFFLGTSDEAATAMDLLLGTQGWRQFVETDVAQLARHEALPRFAKNMAAPLGRDDADLEGLADQLVPVVLDNRDALDYGLAGSPAAGTVVALPLTGSPALQRWGTALLAGGLLVLFAVIVLALARSLGRPRVWVPSALMAGIAAILGVFWLGPQVTSRSNVALVPASQMAEVSAEPAADYMSADDMAPDAITREEAQQSAAHVGRRLGQGPLDSGTAQGAAGVQLGARRQLEEVRVESMRARESIGGGGLGGGGFGGGNAARSGGAPGAGAAVGGRVAAPTTAAPTATAANAAVRRDLAENDAGASEAAETNRNVAKPELLKPTADLFKQRDLPQPSATRAKSMADKVQAPAQSFAGQPTKGAAPMAEAEAPARSQQRSAAEVSGSKREKSKESQLTDAKLQNKLDEKKMAFGTTRFRRIYADNSLWLTRSLNPRPTLLWEPLVITDAMGRATVSFQLPSTNATYLLRADAHGDGRIGSGKSVINVQKP